MGIILNEGGDYFEFSGEIKHQTEKAYLIDVGYEEIWFPKYCTEPDLHQQTFLIPERVAKEKGLI